MLLIRYSGETHCRRIVYGVFFCLLEILDLHVFCGGDFIRFYSLKDTEEIEHVKLEALKELKVINMQ